MKVTIFHTKSRNCLFYSYDMIPISSRSPGYWWVDIESTSAKPVFVRYRKRITNERGYNISGHFVCGF
jgi:hypothetical protein